MLYIFTATRKFGNVLVSGQKKCYQVERALLTDHVTNESAVMIKRFNDGAKCQMSDVNDVSVLFRLSQWSIEFNSFVHQCAYNNVKENKVNTLTKYPNNTDLIMQFSNRINRFIKSIVSNTSFIVTFFNTCINKFTYSPNKRSKWYIVYIFRVFQKGWIE